MRRRLMLEQLDARLVPALFYVAPTGSDSAAGDTDHPWRTLQHAADTVTAGDQVTVRAGSYAGFNLTVDGTTTAPITFTAQPGVTINVPNPSGPHAGKDGVNMEGADFAVIEGFTIVGMPRAGIRSVSNTNVVVRNNVCDLNGKWGIFTGFSENVTIENNVTSRSVDEHGIYVSNSADNPVVRGNTSRGNAACGLHMNSDVTAGGDGVITGALIENNVIYDNGAIGGSAINMDGVSSSRVQNNLLYNNHASGIALFAINGAHGARDNVVANNTVLQAANGRWALLIFNASTGNTVFNNVLMNSDTFRGSMTVSPDSLPGLVSDYNVVMDRFTLDDGGSRLTLAQWRSQTGQDAHSIVSTPAALFANVAGNDFRLAASSPALNAGTGALNGEAAPAIDLVGAGRPSGGGYDAGSYETQVGSSGNPPTANPDSYSVRHDRTLSVPAAGVLANDTSNPAGRTLAAVLVTGPTHGTLTLNANGSFIYVPAAGYIGSDSFMYTAQDGALVSSPATVTVAVTDQAPVAADNAYKTGKGKTLTVAAAGVLTNDSDADGDPLTALLVSGPANGSLTLNLNGSFTYTPNTVFTGTDVFTYKANDNALDSAAATVTIAVARPPRVKSVVFNDGSVQRSLIRSITITFDTLVTLDNGAFGLARVGGGVPSKTRTVTNVNGETQVVLTFSGSGTIYRSLADGNWVLRVFRGKVHRADDRTVIMEADHVMSFHRFFGDSEGDRDVDATDKTAFDAAFGQTDGVSLSTFDFDRDGDIDAADRSRFNVRYGRRI